MAAISAGVRAPEINLSFLDGSKFVLREALKRGPVVAAFFKVGCPGCQMPFPYAERLFKPYGKSAKLTLVGISQDNAALRPAFNPSFATSLPVLLDATSHPLSIPFCF